MVLKVVLHGLVLKGSCVAWSLEVLYCIALNASQGIFTCFFGQGLLHLMDLEGSCIVLSLRALVSVGLRGFLHSMVMEGSCVVWYWMVLL